MATFSGKDGSLTFNGNTAIRVRNWSFSGSMDTLETTGLGEDSRSYVAGLKSATGNATIFYHDDDNSLSTMLDNTIKIKGPNPGVFELKWGAKKIKFTAFITTVNITCSTGEVMSAEISFTMTGNYDTLTL